MSAFLRLLGPPRWQRGDGQTLDFRAERRLQLLAFLGYQAGWVGRDRLAELLWPGRAAPRARANLRKVLHELRQLGVQGIEEGPAGLRWPVPSDVQAFRSACDGGRWADALACGHGELMQGLDEGDGGTSFADWLRAERDEWRVRWREAALQAVLHADTAGAWVIAEQLLALDPLDDEAMATVLRCAWALGDRDRATPAWRRYVDGLERELGLQPPQALVELATGRAGAPLPDDELLGRHDDLQRLSALLQARRLVTVTGPGGVGKTWLARQASQRLGHAAAFVVLDGVGTPAALPSHIAASLGLSLAARMDAVEALARQLAGRNLLLVLDGFEPLIDAADSVRRLLDATPGLRVLVTSRERLDIDGEWLLPLDGLAVPAPDADVPTALTSAAVQLFLRRAAAMRPGLDLHGDIQAVADICRLTDGLPLALELAAVCVRVMPVRDLARELALGGDLWSGQAAGRGLHATFDHSWRLLTATERDAFARLAVFRGGFTREAARQVCGVAVPLLAALVDKSMLRAHADARLSLHPLLLDFARQHHARRADQADLADRHSHWYLGRAARLKGQLPAVERDNVLAAWQRAVAVHDDNAVEQALRHVSWATVVQSRLIDAADLFDQAANAFDAAGATAAQLRAHQAWMLLWLDRDDDAVALAQGALSRLQPLAHDAGCVMALRTLGHAARRAGRHQAAATAFRRALQHAQQAGHADLAAMLHDALAMALNMLGEHEAARRQLQAAQALNDAVGNDHQRMYNLFNQSQSHSLAGDAEAALPCAQAALALGQRIQYGFVLPYLHVELGLVQLALHRLDDAQSHLATGLVLAQGLGDLAAMAWAHEGQVRLSLALHDDAGAQAAAVRGAALGLATRHAAMGAALLPAAARAFADHPRRGRWLWAAAHDPLSQVPVRREAQSLGAPPTATTPGVSGEGPCTVRAALAEIAGGL